MRLATVSDTTKAPLAWSSKASNKRLQALERVTPEIIRSYQEDGFVFLPGLLGQEWVMLAEAGAKRNRANPGPNAMMHFEGNKDREFYDDYCNYAVIPEYQRLLEDSPLADVAAKIIETSGLWLYYDQIFAKEGGKSRRTPWHQDISYFVGDGTQFISTWMTLVELDKEEALECVRGSHRGPVYNGVPTDITAIHKTKLFKESPAVPVPDIDADPTKWGVASWAMKPGDVLFFHPAVLHGGASVREGKKRTSVGFRLFGDNVTYIEREGVKPDPYFAGLSEALTPGDPLRHPWFPQIRP